MIRRLWLWPVLAGLGMAGCTTSVPTPDVPSARTYWSRPTLAADSGGGLLMVWTDLAEAGDDAAAKGDVLRCSALGPQGWTVPARIYSKAPEDWFVAHPQLAAGEQGFFLTWSGWTALHFAKAEGPAETAPGRWSRPQCIASTPAIDRQAILASRAGGLHVVYTCLANNLGGDGNAYYLRSEDHGNTWSRPVSLSRLGREAAAVAAHPQLAEDRLGGLHVVWAERPAPRWLGVQILYTRSTDRGASWSEPEILAQVTGQEVWADAPSLVCTPDGSLHLVWTCGAIPNRCYSASDDQGETWSEPVRLPGGLVSLAGWDALVADPEGKLHLFAQLRFPMGMYHAVKPAALPWRTPEPLTTRQGFENGHYLAAVLAPDGVIHAVWQRASDSGDHAYLRMTTQGEILHASFLQGSPPSGGE